MNFNAHDFPHLTSQQQRFSGLSLRQRIEFTAIRVGALVAILLLGLRPVTAQSTLDSGDADPDLDIGVAATIADYNANSGSPFLYEEVGRVVNLEEGGAVIYMRLLDRGTLLPVRGIIEHLVGLRYSRRWQFWLPGQAGYTTAYGDLPRSVRREVDDLDFRPQANPDLVAPEQLLDYRLPWEDAGWATVIRSYGRHGIGQIDFDLTGRFITAAKDGTIIYANDRYDVNGHATGAWWYWNVIVIQHAPYEYSLYGHLAQGSIPQWIKAGCSDNLTRPNCNVPVRAGHVIASEGSTGYSTAPHLHFETGQQLGLAAYPDTADWDQNGDRREPVYTAHIYAEQDIAFEGYTPQAVASWQRGTLEQASHSPKAPPYVNVVRNGDFTLGVENWQPSGQINWSADDGVMRFLRLTTTEPPDWASFYQNLNIGAPANSPYEVTLQIGNSSAIPKRVYVSLLNTSGRDYGIVTCSFSVPPQSPLSVYSLRGRNPATWANVRFEIGVNPPDGSPAALVDDIQVQYRPDLTIDRTECITPDGVIETPEAGE